jgi:glycosyltransferase involved in cell wall biosynthesis
VGALIEVKGQEQLLVAFADQFREKRDVHLRIGGEGPLRSRLEGMAKRLGIQDQVAFLGELSREGVLAEMERSDVYVHSSRYETFGVTLIEALSCGKAVVSTACGGPECIVQETNGILVAPGDPAALGKAMATITEHIGDYDAVSIRKECLTRFGQKALVDRLSDYYQRVNHPI